MPRASPVGRLPTTDVAASGLTVRTVATLFGRPYLAFKERLRLLERRGFWTTARDPAGARRFTVASLVALSRFMAPGVRHCFGCGQPGHTRRTCPAPVRRPEPPPIRACQTCGGHGHRSATCPARTGLRLPPADSSRCPWPGEALGKVYRTAGDVPPLCPVDQSCWLYRARDGVGCLYGHFYVIRAWVMARQGAETKGLPSRTRPR